ncbi:Uncharacterized protein Fot_12690 [Forsythia ovata]|uniref:Uncharacterized protein n=1 Tax=Forsythia ovata TaxID=205694 RepID=A0ABD1WN93_9LAMI
MSLNRELSEIFSWLSVKGINQFSSVSKSGEELLMDVFFIKKKSENMQVSNSLPGCPITYESLEFLESTGTVLASSNRMLCSKDKRNEGNPLIFNPSTGNLLQNLLHDNLDIDDLNNADEIADEYLLMAIKCQSDCNSTNDIKNSISRFLKVSKNARTVLLHNQNSKQGIFKCENSNSLFKSTNLVIFWKTILTVHWLLINPKVDSRKQIFKMAIKAMGLTRINLMAGLTVQNRKFLRISARDSSGVEEIWSNWFAPWNFEVEHIKRNHNLLLDFLSKSQRTISAMSPIIHVLEPIDLPQHLQEEILQLTLTKRSLENVRELQKLYIHRYGLDHGPILNLPFHSNYPFLTILEMNGHFTFFFPEEAYLLLWYLVDLYAIGIIINVPSVLRYLSMCNRRLKRKYKFLLKWLQLFGSIEWWQRNLEQAKSKYIFATVGSFRKVISERDGIKISREYYCEINYGCEQIDKESKAFHHDRTIMCFANHVDPANVPKELFYTDTSKWYNTDVCPKDYIKEICKCIISFVEQYSWDFEDFDHPIYRVHLRSYPKPKKYVPGLKIYIDDTSDDETDDD